jgi:hypothetical protein
VIRIAGTAVTYGEVWLDEEPPSDRAIDILIYRQRPVPVDHPACNAFLSVVNDLAADPEDIMGRFGRTTRYEIRRAENGDGLHAQVVSPTTASLIAFADFYDAFAVQKSLEPIYRRGLFASRDAGQLVLTTAASGDTVLIWHAYIVWRTSAVLLYSASHFRRESASERALIARANRWLHWRDMLHFRGGAASSATTGAGCSRMRALSSAPASIASSASLAVSGRPRITALYPSAYSALVICVRVP